MNNHKGNLLPVKLEEQSQQMELHNGGGLKAGAIIEKSLSALTPEQVQVLAGKAADEALRLEVKSREQNQDYMFGRKAIEDHTETFEMLDKRGRLTSHKMVSDVNTGAGKMHIESKSGTTCFVATAAYGDANHPDVVFLRLFRDMVLTQYSSGRTFINLYWRIGPSLAYYVSKLMVLKNISRWLISRLVIFLRMMWR